jgi:hypothetical protein
MTLNELEAQRRALAKSQGRRYYKLSKMQGLAELCRLNAPKTKTGSPFPAYKEAA